ncbi:MAG TPA: hypothetical protein VIJ93_01930 [bacterium]
MKIAFAIYRAGAIGLVLIVGVFWQEPLVDSLRQNPVSWLNALILFGFAACCGLFLFSVKPVWLAQGNRTLMYFAHGAALLSILWLILWCFVWLAILSGMGDKAEMLIKHTAYLHLFGVGFSMAGYATAWMLPGLGERSLRFLMTTGWAVSYMAWFNLYLQPGLTWLWAPALGGLLVIGGAFWVSRRLKRAVEAFSQVT